MKPLIVFNKKENLWRVRLIIGLLHILILLNSSLLHKHLLLLLCSLLAMLLFLRFFSKVNGEKMFIEKIKTDKAFRKEKFIQFLIFIVIVLLLTGISIFKTGLYKFF
jgi:hypothetical protein